MAKQLKTEKKQQSGGVDPQMWQSAPAEAVGQVSNQDIASMTGGDAATYEGIVDYILMEEERKPPSEGEILASESAGLLERNYPEEVECEATLQPHETTGTASATESATPTYSATGGGLELGGMSAGDMGLDGLEVGSESQSATAGGGGVKLGMSKNGEVPMGISGGTEGGRVVDHKADDVKVFKAIGGPDPQQLSAQNATVLAGMQGMAEGLAGQIDGAVGTALGTVDSAYNSNSSTLDGAFGANLGLIQSSFAMARGRVDASAMAAKSGVEKKSAQALATIQTDSAKMLSDGDAWIAGAAAAIQSKASSAEAQAIGKVSAAQTQARTIADKWAAEAKKKGDSMAAAYRGRGNGGTEGKRDEARGQVAESYGEGYHEDLPTVGQEAVQTLEEEKKNVRSAFREMIKPVLETELPTLQEMLHADVNAAAQEAKQGVEQSRDAAMTGIEEQHTAAGEELASSESTAKDDLIEVYVDGRTDLADMNSLGKDSLEVMGAGIRGHIVEKAQQLRAVIAKNPALPLDALQKEVGSLSMALTQYAVDGQAAIKAVAQDQAEEQTAFTQATVQEMDSIGTSAAEGAFAIADQAETSFDDLSATFEADVDKLLEGFDTNLSDLRSQLNANLHTLTSTVFGGIDDTLAGVESGVADFLTGFDSDLNTAVNTEMVNDIEAKAEEEAAKIKEPSFWDKVVAVVAVVVLVVAVIAITVATAGIGTAVMAAASGAIAAAGITGWAAVALTVVVAAAIGAVSSALTEIVMQIAQFGINPANWDWKKIGMEALIGGVLGGITFGVGNGVAALGRWGTKVTSATNALRSPAVMRIANFTARFGDDVKNLTKVGEYAADIGSTILGEAAKWGITGERPDLGEVATEFAIGAVTSEWAGGMTDTLLPSSDPEWLKDSFTAYMEEIAEEARTGSTTEAILEKVEAPVAELGGVELSTDYKPEWSPTW